MSRIRYLLYDLVDKQVVDCEGERCGRVDDVELTGDPPQIAYLIVGMGADRRSIVARLVHAVASRVYRALGATGPLAPVKVAWTDVDEWNGTVRLKRKDGALGLRRMEDAMAQVVRRWSGA